MKHPTKLYNFGLEEEEEEEEEEAAGMFRMVLYHMPEVVQALVVQTTQAHLCW